MAVFKCKMCGGELEISNETIAVCNFCDTKQTLPKLNDDRKANLYDRANHLRRNNEFDKAMSIYEQILNEDNTDSEAYWSLVLCRYGVEYVEDPSSRKRVPTVNRAQFTSVFNDEDYKSALQHADIFQKEIYQQEASVINEIQKGILAISSQEEPFDVFICYKETDNYGRRTPDSVIATELYHELTREGYKVFFSRITLEDKLGTAYEPYIFAALNSAKVMVVLGTKPEHFNAVWVKNEWSRYLALIKNGAKKMLIPAYKDMDPYTLPEEFSHLQAQDMSKLGFMQDLIRGIKKIIQTDAPKDSVASTQNNSVAPLLERTLMFIEDGDWKSANEYCEKVLDIMPKNAQAYLYKLMIQCRVKNPDDIKKINRPLSNNDFYLKIMRYGDESIKNQLEEYNRYILDFIKNNNVEGVYVSAVNLFNSARTTVDFENAFKSFVELKGYKNSNELAKQCKYNAIDVKYNDAVKMLESARYPKDFETAATRFAELGKHKNSVELVGYCKNKAKEARYNDAVSYYKAAKSPKECQKASELFADLGGYKDSATWIQKCNNRIEHSRKSKTTNIGLLITTTILTVILFIVATGMYSTYEGFLNAFLFVVVFSAIGAGIPGFLTFLTFILNISQKKSSGNGLKILTTIVNVIFAIATVIFALIYLIVNHGDFFMTAPFIYMALINVIFFFDTILIKTYK